MKKIIILSIICILLSINYIYSKDISADTGIALKDNIELYDNYQKNKKKIKTVLNKNQIFKIIGKSEERAFHKDKENSYFWYQIEINDKNKSWVFGKNIAINALSTYIKVNDRNFLNYCGMQADITGDNKKETIYFFINDEKTDLDYMPYCTRTYLVSVGDKINVTNDIMYYGPGSSGTILNSMIFKDLTNDGKDEIILILDESVTEVGIVSKQVHIFNLNKNEFKEVFSDNINICSIISFVTQNNEFKDIRINGVKIETNTINLISDKIGKLYNIKRRVNKYTWNTSKLEYEKYKSKLKFNFLEAKTKNKSLKIKKDYKSNTTAEQKFDINENLELTKIYGFTLETTEDTDLNAIWFYAEFEDDPDKNCWINYKDLVFDDDYMKYYIEHKKYSDDIYNKNINIIIK